MTRYLLDTHILLGILKADLNGFPSDIVQVLENPQSELHVSAASLWEMAIKVRLGKLQIGTAIEHSPELIAELGLKIVAVEARHAVATVAPEPPTRDPFDRMLLAQCQSDGFKLITIDRALVDHPISFKVIG